MKNLFENQDQQLDFNSLGSILSSGVAVGVAIAKYAGKNPQTGGIIGVGLSLLVTGLVIALDDDKKINKKDN